VGCFSNSHTRPEALLIGGPRQQRPWVLQLVLGTGVYDINWAEALVAGLVGSFVGGLLASLLAGDGISLRPSGLIGSIVGAIAVSAAYGWYQSRRRIA
jgi:uncharacterized membrane protein YeaQ/YmgE (transglycosylase-associated protein family)